MLPDGWKKATLGEIAEIITGTTPPTKNQCNYGGAYPFVGPADLGLKKYIDSSDKTLSEQGWLLSRQLDSGSVLFTCIGSTIGKIGITRTKLATNQQINAIVSNGLIDSEYLYYYLSSKAESIKLIAGKQAVPIINKSEFSETLIHSPPLPEQRKIAAILRTWDEGIEKMETLMQHYEKRFDFMVRRFCLDCLSADHSLWGKVRLGEIFKEREDTGFLDEKLLSITGSDGIVERDTIDRKDTSNSDKSKYRLICHGDIGYNTMRMWQGVCGLSEMRGIVSPAYTICIPNGSLVDPVFFSFLFKLPKMFHQFRRYSQGLVDDTLGLKFHHFSEIKINLPPLEYQRNVSKILTHQKLVISECQKMMGLLKKQKRGLMQKLLTGKWRVKI